MRCLQELCINWSGDGNVCPCALFDLDPWCGESRCGECSRCQEFADDD